MSDTPSAAPPRARKARRWGLLFVGLTCSLVVDLATKAWAWNVLRDEPGQSIMLLAPTLELAFAQNTGAAFSFLAGVSWARAFFVLTAIALSSFLVFVAWRLPTIDWKGFLGVGLLLGGALGNVHDRLFRANDFGVYGVVDFIKINYPWGGSWPTFNVADIAILVGMVLLVLHRSARKTEASERSPRAEPA
jgi:signal peptidase II